MILPVHDAIRTRLSQVLTDLYRLTPETLPALPLESPPNRAMGDLATPVAFELARRLRKAPRAIAQELAGAMGTLEGIRRVEATPNGYINIFLDRPAFLTARLARDVAGLSAPSGGKTIVEHTAINPNKAAHVGHLRNSALGDTLVRVLRFRGRTVEVQNYIDDTGVQVADVVVGFRELEHQTLEGIRAIADSTRFDYYCWDLYARVTDWYAQDKERLKARAAALHDIEHGESDAAAIAGFVADRIVRCHLKTMARMNVDYDLLTWEGDILRLQFWARAFEILKEKGAVYLQTEGRLAGCWVMRIESDEEPEQEGGETSGNVVTPAADSDDMGNEKVIVRSNGTVTYVGKDMAYQLWKFGLLGHDFRYRVFGERAGGGPLWATTALSQQASSTHPRFGGAGTTYNVIDVRQSYLQKLLKQALTTLGYTLQAERCIHFSYEMVALSRQTAATLGYISSADVAEDDKGFVEVSGRKGQGVKADDLLDALEKDALSEVVQRNPELGNEERQRIAHMIAVAAVRYLMIKYSRTKVIAFDLAEALSFEGETGPYLQYAVVRAQNIFNKLRERDNLGESEVVHGLSETPATELEGADGAHDLWALVLEAARLDEVVEQVIRTLEFSVLAKYAFGLAQSFNAFYHRYPILNEERQDVRRWRAAGVSYFRRQLTRTLDLMGIAVPSRM
jgi:arginyl-tRNA synthetase